MEISYFMVFLLCINIRKRASACNKNIKQFISSSYLVCHKDNTKPDMKQQFSRYTSRYNRRKGYSRKG